MERRREQPRPTPEVEPLDIEPVEGPPRPTPDQQKEAQERREFERAAAGLEMSVEDTANALEGLVGQVDAGMKHKIIEALVDNIREIPQERRQKLLERVKGNFERRAAEGQERQLRPEEQRKREANLELMNEIDSRLYTEMPEGDVIELTEVVEDEEPLELDLGDQEKRAA